MRAGTRLGPYEIIDLLGAGGMGEVWRARDTRLRREVAVKVLPPAKTSDAARVSRFELEARTASALNHPNILTIHDVGTWQGTSYLVSELLKGRSLREVLQEGQLPLSHVVDLAGQICQGLATAHDKGIIHRDLKPENLFLTDDGRVKILDFGLARLSAGTLESTNGTEVATQEQLTREGTVLGTVGYMSPEQVRGERVEAASDVFSLGCVLYEALTGSRPFQRDTAAESMTAILREEPPPLSAKRPDAPPALERVLRRCLAKRPVDRFGSARELLYALEVASESTSSGVSGSHPVSRGVFPGAADAEPAVGHRRTVGIAAALAAIALVVTLVVFLVARGAPSSDAAVIDSLVVLPFEDLVDDPNQKYLSHGLTEELINALGRVEGLRVPGRSSSFAFAPGEVDYAEVERRLDVAAALEGSIQASGDRLRVRVQLVSLSGGFQLWSESYDRSRDDLFDVQQEIVRGIVERLTAEARGLESADQPRLAEAPDPDVYRLVLEGRYHRNRRSREDLMRAREKFEAAIERQPGYAAAHAGRSDVLTLMAEQGYLPHEGSLAEALAAARRAIELDPLSVEAHTALGHGLAHSELWEESEREFLRALELDPRHLNAHGWFGVDLLSTRGRYDEAVAHLERVVEIDPLFPVGQYWLGRALIEARRFDEAVPYLLTAQELGLERHPNVVLAQAYSRIGRHAEAIEQARLGAMHPEARPYESVSLVYVLARAGNEDEARRIMQELEADPTMPAEWPVTLAMGWAALGESERAVALLERSTELRAADLKGMLFDPIRDDPGFQDVVAGLEAHAR